MSGLNTLSSNAHIFFLMGKSGAGKNEIIKRLLEDTSLGLSQILSAKTRPLRPGEKDGVDFHHLSPWAFLDAVAKNEFLEWVWEEELDKSTGEKTGVTHYYGTRLWDMITAIQQWGLYIKEMEYKWYELAKDTPYRPFIHGIFIHVSTPHALERIQRRAPLPEDQLLRRTKKMDNEDIWLQETRHPIHLIDNDEQTDDLDRRELLFGNIIQQIKTIILTVSTC